MTYTTNTYVNDQLWLALPTVRPMAFWDQLWAVLTMRLVTGCGAGLHPSVWLTALIANGYTMHYRRL